MTMKLIGSTSAKTAQLAAAPAQRSCEDVLSGSLHDQHKHNNDDGGGDFWISDAHHYVENEDDIEYDDTSQLPVAKTIFLCYQHRYPNIDNRDLLVERLTELQGGAVQFLMGL